MLLFQRLEKKELNKLIDTDNRMVTARGDGGSELG